MKRLIIALTLLVSTWNVSAQCSDEDTVRSNSVSMITATTARVNGTTTHFSGFVTSLALRYVRVGHTDTTTATQVGTSALRNLTGLAASTTYYYYYVTTCGSSTIRQLGPYYFMTSTNNVLYVPERPTVFQYVKTDTGGVAFVPSDTLKWRTPSDLAIIKYKASDNTFYGYYPNCTCWHALATDSAGIIASLDLKVDSVTVSGDSLFWWNDHGVSHGYILPALASQWKFDGNTVGSLKTIGTIDAFGFKIITNSNQSGYIDIVNQNTSLGESTMESNISGVTNNAFGRYALRHNTTGNTNTAMGDQALTINTTGSANTMIGSSAGSSISTASGNTGVGGGAMVLTNTGATNVAIGNNGLGSNTTGSGNVGLGYTAGRYSTTASNQYFLNNQDRSNYTGDTTKSLVYGVFNATAASQRFKINGRLEINDGTQASGYVFVGDANGIGHWAAPGSIVTATPTWQQTLTAGSTFTGSNTIDMDGNEMIWTNSAGMLFNGTIPVVIGSNTTSGNDSNLTVVNGIWGKRGVRFSGLPTSGTYYKTVAITSDGTLYLKDTVAAGTNAWVKSLNSITAATDKFGTSNNTSLNIYTNNVNAATLDSLGARFFLKNGFNPLLSLKQKTSNQEWQLRVGVNTGTSNSAFNIYDATNSKIRQYWSADQTAIGDVTSIPSETMLYLRGNSLRAATFDARGDSTSGFDFSAIEAEKSDYTNGEGIAIEVFGNVGISGSTNGWALKNLSRVRMRNTINLIEVQGAHRMYFGTNDTVRMKIDSIGGAVAINSLTASQLVQTDGNKYLISTTALPNGTTATTQAPGTNNTTVATTAYVATAVAAAPTGITIGTTTITSGTNTRILYNNNGVAGEYTLTGTGTVVAMQTAPTFVTSATVPLLIGGTGTTSTLTLQPTSGVGTTNADIVALVGNNGATEAWRTLNNGNTQFRSTVTIGYLGSGSSVGYYIQNAGVAKWSMRNDAGTTSNGFNIIPSSGNVFFEMAQSGLITVGTNEAPTSSLKVNGSFATAIVTKTADYIATVSDHTILGSTNTITITLPTPVGISGRIYVVKNITSGTTVTVGTAAGNIDGVATKSINTQYSGFQFQSDNSNWNIIGVF